MPNQELSHLRYLSTYLGTVFFGCEIRVKRKMSSFNFIEIFRGTVGKYMLATNLQGLRPGVGLCYYPMAWHGFCVFHLPISDIIFCPSCFSSHYFSSNSPQLLPTYVAIENKIPITRFKCSRSKGLMSSSLWPRTSKRRMPFSGLTGTLTSLPFEPDLLSLKFQQTRVSG